MGRDGQFNPDRLLVNDTGHFQAMSDGVFYNALAWVLTGSDTYAAKSAGYLDTWFINPDSAMREWIALNSFPSKTHPPDQNLDYAQMERGPNGEKGTHTGLL